MKEARCHYSGLFYCDVSSRTPLSSLLSDRTIFTSIPAILVRDIAGSLCENKLTDEQDLITIRKKGTGSEESPGNGPHDPQQGDQ
jgi:hypothetical protein